MVSHRGPELEFHTRTVRGPIADGERTFSIEEFDEHIVADDPLVVSPQMREKILSFRVRRLVIQECVASLPLHVRLAGEYKNLHRLVGGKLVCGMHRRGRQ